MNLKAQAELSLHAGLRVVLEHIPNDEIQAVYAKGSIVHGEMNSESDVDLVVILKSETHFRAIGELSKKSGHTVQPPFSLGMYTLDELKTGKVSTLRTSGMTPISRFVKSIDGLRLLYGSKPEGELFSRSVTRDLFNNIHTFRTLFLPKFADGTFTFQEILKQVFWLGEAEQRCRGIKTEYSWASIASSFEGPDHVVKDALRLRRAEKCTEDDRVKFVKKLETYLTELELTTDNLGLDRNIVEVREYDPVWKEVFEKERLYLLSQFPDEILEVSHGGSTSVPGMAAKPIIDMFAAVPNLANAKQLRERLEALGYHYRGEEGVPGRILYAKGAGEIRTHHLNLVEKTNDQWHNHISLREYYIRHPDIAKEYVALKEKLSHMYPNDRNAYGMGKKDFVRSVLERAQAEGL